MSFKGLQNVVAAKGLRIGMISGDGIGRVVLPVRLPFLIFFFEIIWINTHDPSIVAPNPL
jgi:hypothetical protein